MRKRGDSDHPTASAAKAAFEALDVSGPHWANVWRLGGTPELVWQGWRTGASETRWTRLAAPRESWVGRLRRAITGGSEDCAKVPRARGDRRGVRTRRRPDAEPKR